MHRFELREQAFAARENQHQAQGEFRILKCAGAKQTARISPIAALTMKLGKCGTATGSGEELCVALRALIRRHRGALRAALTRPDICSKNRDGYPVLPSRRRGVQTSGCDSGLRCGGDCGTAFLFSAFSGDSLPDEGP